MVDIPQSGFASPNYFAQIVLRVFRPDSYSQRCSPRRASLPSPRLLMADAGVCAVSPLGKHPTPLRSHRAPYLSSLCHTTNSHQLAINILLVVMCMFQRHSPNSSRLLLPPLCSQVCSLCLRFHWVLFLKLFVFGEKIEPTDIVYQYVPSTLLDIDNMTSVNPPYHL